MLLTVQTAHYTKLALLQNFYRLREEICPRKMPPPYFCCPRVKPELVGANIHLMIVSLGLKVVLGSHWLPKEQRQMGI